MTMRRGSTRRTGVMPAPVAQATAKSNTREADKIDGLFSRYAEADDRQLIGPEGIESLCRDMEMEPTDFRILLLAWKLQAGKQGFFTLEEWRSGMKAMRADSLDKLKRALALLQQEVASNQETFKKMHTFAFQYCLTEPRQKTLDLDTACQMLQLVMGDRPHLSQFLQFLQEQKEYKVINLDQWTGFLRFSEEVEEDMSDYDESQAWPLLMDNFVEWCRKDRAES